MGPAAFGLLFHLFGINILADDLPETELNTTLSNNATAVVKILKDNLVTLGLNSTNIMDEKEEGMSTLAVIVETLPGIPFLLMATCVLGAIVAALFLDNITKGMDDQEPQHPSGPKVEEVGGNSSSFQSENSETKMEIKSNSNSSISSLADVNGVKVELTELTGCEAEEEEEEEEEKIKVEVEEGKKIHINGRTIKASYAA